MNTVLNIVILGLLSLANVAYSSRFLGNCGDRAHGDSEEVTELIEQIVKVDDGNQTISTENSEVVIITTAIQEIVKSGPKTVPLLIKAMKNHRLSFDTFARCYSASSQILGRIDRDTHIYWSGGCETRKSALNVARVFPRGQMNESEFRRKVVADIELKFETLKKKGRIQQ